MGRVMGIKTDSFCFFCVTFSRQEAETGKKVEEEQKKKHREREREKKGE